VDFVDFSAMSEKKPGLLQYLGQAWLVLMLSVCFGAALAGVERFTRPKFEQNVKDFIARRLVEMFGPGTTTAEPTVLAVQIEGRDRKVRCYPALRDGRRVGWGIEAEGKGYDTLLLVIGVDEQVKQLKGYRVITSLETEGIGDVIEKDALFMKQFEDKDAARPLEPVAEAAPAEGNQVNTRTGATYSTTGVVNTINDTLAAVREKLAAAAKEGP
jgi:Na+-translocating ferredoxin:NAD+ oxidoreductase RnfG subunit